MAEDKLQSMTQHKICIEESVSACTSILLAGIRDQGLPGAGRPLAAGRGLGIFRFSGIRDRDQGLGISGTRV